MNASRSLSLTLLTAFVLVFSSGCGISKKPRNHWWQFWRTKTPKLSAMGAAGSFSDPLGEPPAPLGGLGAGGVGSIADGSNPFGIQQAGAPRGPAIPVSDLHTVFFDFDGWHITQETANTLNSNADWIRANPGYEIQIQGHCDERGTLEYNTNLGQLRADSVREYLVQSGLDPNQLHSISYGEDRPLAVGFDEVSYQQNRRVEFLVYDPNG